MLAYHCVSYVIDRSITLSRSRIKSRLIVEILVTSGVKLLRTSDLLRQARAKCSLKDTQRFKYWFCKSDLERREVTIKEKEDNSTTRERMIFSSEFPFHWRQESRTDITAKALFGLIFQLVHSSLLQGQSYWRRLECTSWNIGPNKALCRSVSPAISLVYFT